MTADRDATRLISTWLQETADALPDNEPFFDRWLDQLPAVDQRRRDRSPRRLLGWRTSRAPAAPPASAEHAAVGVPARTVQAMSSATRFVVAGAIVALFGGFLLGGVLTTPDGEQVAPAAASSSPTATLLSTLVTEEVRPGVFRVVDDGHRDLSTSVWDVAVSGTGDVWVDRLVDGARHLVRLGSEREYPLHAEDVDPIGRALSVDHDGSIRATPDGGDPRSEMTFDGEAWVPAEERLALGGGGTGDAVEGDGFRASVGDGRLEVVRESVDGVESAHLDLYSTDITFRLTDEGGGVLVAAGSDGTVWVSLSTPGSRLFKLAKFDGRAFDRVGTGGPTGPSRAGLDESGQNVLTDIAEAPDGTLWVSSWLRHADVLYVWSWDGVAWTAYDPVETKAGEAWPEVWAGSFPRAGGSGGNGPWTGTWFEPDGSIRFNGLVHFDGERFTPLDAPVVSADGSTVVSAISVAPDGAIWIVIVGGYPEGCEDSVTSITCGMSSEGLYVITREAVVGTE